MMTTRHSMMVRTALASLTIGLLALGAGCDTTPPDAGQPAAGAPAPMVDSLGTPLGPITSALVKKNAETTSKMKLLARVEVQPNEMLEFFEGEPGNILVTGAGAPQAGMAVGEDMARTVSYRTLWEKAAHGKPMPAALASAIGNMMDELPRPQPVEAAAPLPGRTERNASGKSRLDAAQGTTATTLADLPVDTTPRVLYGDQDKTGIGGTGAAGWCQNQYYYTAASQGGPVFGACPKNASDGWACLDNWWNGAFAATRGAVHSLSDNVCPINGWVLLHTDTPGFFPTPIDFWVAPNTVRWVFRANIKPWCVPFCNDNYFTGRADVQQATNVEFNFRWSAYK
jgi:hypothetical protein